MKKSIVLILPVSCLLLSAAMLRCAAQEVPQYKELRAYRASGQVWRNILIPKKLSKNQIIILAKELHKADATSSFNILDDDSQFEEFVNGETNIRNSSPEKWIAIHHIAMINKMFRDKLEWDLLAMEGWAKYTHSKESFTDKIVSLEP